MSGTFFREIEHGEFAVIYLGRFVVCLCGFEFVVEVSNGYAQDGVCSRSSTVSGDFT